MQEKIKVMLVEDDRDFAFLIKKLISREPKLEIIACESEKAAGLESARRNNPDIVLMDLNLSGSELDGVEAAREIRLATGAKVLLLTSYEQPEIIIKASKKAFASGYIFKSQCQALSDTIYKTAVSSTPQEQFIKELLLQDLTPAERSVLSALIGKSPTVSSLKTIANQKTSIFRKLGFKNTNEVVSIFRGW